MQVETIHATGDEHVTASHTSTFEVTADSFLTPAGDCILGIHADKTPSEFSNVFVAACQSRSTTITACIRIDDESTAITGTGHPDLTFSSSRSLVGRTSEYVDDRTVMVNADGAADSIPRDLVALLRDGADLTMTLEAE